MSNISSTDNYKERLDRKCSELIDEWWNTLSKDDLLEFIRDTKSITADQLRVLFKNENVQIRANFLFMTATNQAQLDFNGNPSMIPTTGSVAASEQEIDPELEPDMGNTLD